MTAARDQVRIIGGTWRGRRVGFVPAGVRPTPDRVRETLFNWLAPRLPGARVLDLCAGSGVLGFEALSRGAAGAVLVEHDRAQAARLRAEATRLGAAAAQVCGADARAAVRALAGTGATFDVAFIDPPYASGLAAVLMHDLDGAGVLAPAACVYLETPAREPVPVPPGWQVHRSGRAGEVGYHLLTRART